MKKTHVKFLAALVVALLILVGTALFSITDAGRTIWYTFKGSPSITHDGIEANELGFEIVDCVNRHTLIARLREGNRVTELKAYGSPWDAAEFHVKGMIGWHVTWLAILPSEVMPLTGYETYGISGGSMWAREVPPRVVSALQKCGVAWGGSWPHDLSPPKKDAPRKPRPNSLAVQFGEDLLPPPL